MSKQNDVPQHTYRFPFRINMPLLILFWDAKNRACIHSGCIWEYLRMLRVSVVAAVVYWIAYNKAAESGIKRIAKTQTLVARFCQ